MAEHGQHRPLVKAALIALLLWSTAAAADCRQALVLGLDVSGSVDEAEYAVQRQGLANAITNPEVRDLLLPNGGAVALAIFEWSGPHDQHLIVPWTEITSHDDLAEITERLRTVPRQKGEVSTAMGSAIAAGDRLLADQPDCAMHTLDLSGDGTSNSGPRPRDIKTGEIIVNGLAILPADTTESARLSAYFHAYVLRGGGAFLETALGFDDFERAMVRKLKKELSLPVLGQLNGGHDILSMPVIHQ